MAVPIQKTLCVMLCCIRAYTALFAETLSLMTFNVQNLFDGTQNGSEYSEYRPPSYTEKEYQQRLVAIGKAIQSISRPVHIIALQEVENTSVIHDLQMYYLPSFRHSVITDNDHGAVEVALLSRYAPYAVHTHTLQTWYGARSLRPILDVTLRVQTGDYKYVQVLVVHLKSQREATRGQGAVSSQKTRLYQYTLLASVIDDSIPTIIVGDFNDQNPIASISQFGSFLIEPGVSAYNDTHDYTKSPINGTYYYNSSWSMLDHVLIDSVYDDALTNASATIMAKEPFITKKGLPNRALSRTSYVYAVSDHLPLVFTGTWKK